MAEKRGEFSFHNSCQKYSFDSARTRCILIRYRIIAQGEARPNDRADKANRLAGFPNTIAELPLAFGQMSIFPKVVSIQNVTEKKYSKPNGNDGILNEKSDSFQ